METDEGKTDTAARAAFAKVLRAKRLSLQLFAANNKFRPMERLPPVWQQRDE